MVINLRLKNFRQYEDQTIEFRPHFNLIKGRNNAGKTTIFYAICYNLFGHVQGFKNFRQLAQTGKNMFGIECIITVKDQIYKIQRLHKLGKTSSKCIFTLSIVKEPGEEIILSSDYGDSLETFNKKLVEIIGFSRKFFEFAIFYRQGELLSILNGNKNVDLILGINAFIEFNRGLTIRIKQIEKELVKLPLFKDEINNINEERKDAKEQIRHYKFYVDYYSSNIKKNEEFIQKYKELEVGESNDELLKIFNALKSLREEILKNKGKLEDIKNSFEKEFAETISSTYFDEKTSKLKLNKEKIREKIDSKHKELGKNTEKIGMYNKQWGNFDGILIRKKKLIDKSTCEYCDAPISQEKVSNDIKSYEIKKKDVELTLKDAKENKKQIEKEIVYLRDKMKQIDEHIQEINRSKIIFTEITEKKEKLTKDSEFLANKINSQFAQLIERVNTFFRLMKRLENYDIYWALESLISTISSIKSDPMKCEILGEGMNTVISKISNSNYEAKNDIEHYKRSLKDDQKNLDIFSDKKKRYDKRLKYLNLEKRILQKQEQKISVYKDLVSQNIKILRKIRQQSLIRLDEQIKYYYELLSDQHEFEDIIINPENYSVEIKVKGFEEYFPASIYQGGGQKLILSLAYKLALGTFFKNPLFILADEPTYGADVKNRKNILQKLKNFPHFFHLILITHQNPELFEKDEVITIKKKDNISFVE